MRDACYQRAREVRSAGKRQVGGGQVDYCTRTVVVRVTRYSYSTRTRRLRVLVPVDRGISLPPARGARRAPPGVMLCVV
jgi:hypothetical protein